MFLLIAPTTREIILALFIHARDWVVLWAPVSYIVLGLVVLAPLVAFQLMAHWPVVEEPENPMARYKREAENLDVD